MCIDCSEYSCPEGHLFDFAGPGEGLWQLALAFRSTHLKMMTLKSYTLPPKASQKPLQNFQRPCYSCLQISQSAPVRTRKGGKEEEFYSRVFLLSSDFRDFLPGLHLASEMKLGFATWSPASGNFPEEEEKWPPSLPEGSRVTGCETMRSDNHHISHCPFYWVEPWVYPARAFSRFIICTRR